MPFARHPAGLHEAGSHVQKGERLMLQILNLAGPLAALLVANA